jgi:ferredoxin/flavodoxin
VKILKGILYYFSGTGNTKWIADKMKYYFDLKGYELNLCSIEDIEDLNISKHKFIVIGTPIYGKSAPKLVEKFIKKIPNTKENMKCIIYSTQGSKSCAYIEIIKNILHKKGYNVVVQTTITMPNNYYFALGKISKINYVESILNLADKKVKYIVNKFVNNNIYIEKTYFIQLKLEALVSKAFKKTLPKLLKNLQVTNECMSCGRCIRNCPTSNITLENGKVVFHNNCILCLRCIYICPINAITYKGRKIVQIQNNIIKSLDIK